MATEEKTNPTILESPDRMMAKAEAVNVEVKDGQIIIHDAYGYVNRNKTIACVKIIPLQGPERIYTIQRTKHGGYLFN